MCVLKDADPHLSLTHARKHIFIIRGNVRLARQFVLVGSLMILHYSPSDDSVELSGIELNQFPRELLLLHICNKISLMPRGI